MELSPFDIKLGAESRETKDGTDVVNGLAVALAVEMAVPLDAGRPSSRRGAGLPIADAEKTMETQRAPANILVAFMATDELQK